MAVSPQQQIGSQIGAGGLNALLAGQLQGQQQQTPLALDQLPINNGVGQQLPMQFAGAAQGNQPQATASGTPPHAGLSDLKWGNIGAAGVGGAAVGGGLGLLGGPFAPISVPAGAGLGGLLGLGAGAFNELRQGSPSQKAHDAKVTGGGAGGGLSSNDPLHPDKLASYRTQLLGAGYTPGDADAIITQYSQQIGKANAAKNLPPEMATILQNFQPGSSTPAQPAQNPYGDPLALQLFFSKTVAPYLASLGQDIRGNADQYGQVQNAIMAKTPPSATYRPVMEAGTATATKNMNQMADALAATALAGPEFSNQTSQISNLMNAQRQAYEVGLRRAQQQQTVDTLLTSGALNSLLGK